MENDPLESLLRQADPHSDDQQTQVAPYRLRWNELAAKRQASRRRLRSACKIAGVILIAAFISYALLRRPAEQENRRSAMVQPSVEKVGQTNERNVPSASVPPKTDIASPLPSAVPSVAKSKTTAASSFEQFVEAAGAPGSVSWENAVRQLATSHPQIQRNTIGLVERITDPSKRQDAMNLVATAAASDANQLLIHWLDRPAVRSFAWQRLLESATPDERLRLIEVARTDRERRQMCDAIIHHPDASTIRNLVMLVQDQRWRTAFRDTAPAIRPEHLTTLIDLIRSGDREYRAGAVFVIASVRDQQIDRQLAQLILQGRDQQAAYIALLSRDTPQAKTFLAHAAARPPLAAALYSAHAHFVSIKPRLHFWLTQFQGDHDEPATTSDRQDAMASDVRLVRHADLLGGNS